MIYFAPNKKLFSSCVFEIGWFVESIVNQYWLVSLRFVPLYATAKRIPFKILLPLSTVTNLIMGPYCIILLNTLPCCATWQIAKSLLPPITNNRLLHQDLTIAQVLLYRDETKIEPVLWYIEMTDFCCINY